MKNTLFLSLMAIVLVRCGQSEPFPDVSGIPMPVTVYRSEQVLFSYDSTKAAAALNTIRQQDQAFLGFFSQQILEVPPTIDKDEQNAIFGSYLNQYAPVFKSSEKQFQSFKPYEEEMILTFRLAKHYFGESFTPPRRIVTYIGPFNDWSNILAPNGDLYIGLQYHLDTLSDFYQHPLFKEHYPDYIVRRFTPEYIAVRTAENLITDLYPETTDEKTLIQHMVEKGKRLFLMQQLLPKKARHLLIGYTENQYARSLENEAAIWQLFLQDNRLQSMNVNHIRTYIGDSPKTQELSEEAPGNLGAFIGWRIIQRYMDKYPETTMKELLSLPADQLLQKTKYKP
ncbi:MAG: hypothetical protein ACKO5C_05590 [Ferruginibacter sp.]